MCEIVCTKPFYLLSHPLFKGISSSFLLSFFYFHEIVYTLIFLINLVTFPVFLPLLYVILQIKQLNNNDPQNPVIEQQYFSLYFPAFLPVSQLRIKLPRMKYPPEYLHSLPIPWILCGPPFPTDNTGLPAGSTATTLTSGFFSFKNCPTPVIVPPVPTPATKISTFPSVSSQISGPVVLLCISGFASFLNCYGI